MHAAMDIYLNADEQMEMEMEMEAEYLVMESTEHFFDNLDHVIGDTEGFERFVADYFTQVMGDYANTDA